MQTHLVLCLVAVLEQGHQTQGPPQVLLAQEQGSLLGSFGSDPAQLCQAAPAEPGALWGGTGKCISNSCRWHSTLTNPGTNTLRGRQEPDSLWLSPENVFPAELWLIVLMPPLRWSSFLRQGGLLCPKPCLAHQSPRARELCAVCSGYSHRDGAHPTGGDALCKSWKR